MEVLEIEWKSEKQKSVIMNLLEELQVTYRSITSENEEYELYGEGFKKSVIEINKACDAGDTSRFVEMEIEDLCK